MDQSKIIFLANDDVRAVTACYEPDGNVGVFKTFDKSIKPGDLVAVESTTRHNVTTAKIVDVDTDIDFDAAGVYKWVVQRIDTELHSRVLEAEKEVISAARKAQLAKQRRELAEAHAVATSGVAVDYALIEGEVSKD